MGINTDKHVQPPALYPSCLLLLPAFPLLPHHSMCHATDHQKKTQRKKQPSQHRSDRPHLFPVKSFICPYSTVPGPVTSTHFFFRSFVISGTACKHQCQGSARSPLTPTDSACAVPALQLHCPPTQHSTPGAVGHPSSSTPHLSPAE